MSTSKKEASSRATKRARFAGQKEKSGGASPLVLIAGLVVVVAIIGGIIFALTRSSPTVADSPASPLLAVTECEGDACEATLAGAPANSLLSELTSFPTGSQGLLVSAATRGHEPYPLVVAENGEIRLSLATFDDYKAHHYTYMHEGQPIEFFVLKSKDGTVRAAFNACDVCFQSKKGYTQDGDYMICNNCGRRFPADQINDVHGGCNPSPLTRIVDGDTLVIEAEDIIAGKIYF